jgi:uncharacterized protein
MKRIASILLLLSVLIPTSVFSYQSPGRPTGAVNDFVGVFSTEQKVILENTLSQFYTETGNAIVIAVVPTLSDSSGPESIESYAVKLFADWGIGGEKEDRGVLILVAPNEREARIEVGYGLEPVVTDVMSGLIMRNVMVPLFAESKYAEGISLGAGKIIEGIRNSNDPEFLASIEDNRITWDLSSGTTYVLLIIAFSIIRALFSKTKSWWLGGVLGAVAGIIIGFIAGFIYAGIISIVILTLLGLILDYIYSKHGGSGGTHFWGGGFGGSGGGGFGGFGGGMSGGGGSSGRW